MEIEVGDYVRTNDGIIAKAKKKAKYIVELETTTGETRHYIVEEISKHSKNIIDLIEAWDIIECEFNIMYVAYAVVKPYTDGRTRKEILRVNEYDIHNVKIKSILTHEQYKQNCFRMEGE